MTMHNHVSRPRSTRVTAARAASQRTKLTQTEEGLALTPTFPSATNTAALPGLRSVMTIDLAILQFLQDLVGGNRSTKTIEWHQTSLKFFQEYLLSACHFLQITQITATEVSTWFTWLRQTPGARGKPRTARTVETYARSARAFCNWLVKCSYLDHTPFEMVTFPKAGKPLIRLIDPEEFERLLLA